MKIAYDRQKSYVNTHRSPLQFEVSDMVFLKVSPMKNIMRFGTKGKLSPRYVGPYKIIVEVGDVAYRFELPPSLSQILNVFHISSLRRYVANLSHVLKTEFLQIKENLTYEEVPVQNLDRRIQQHQTKAVMLVKVLWRSHSIEEATWETKDEMKAKYLHIFQKGM